MKKHPNFDDQSLFSITDYFKNNVCVIKTKEKYDAQENSFSFTLFSKEDILKVIKSLSSYKASPIEDMPIKILKNSIHISSEKLNLTHSKKQILLRFLKKGNDNEKENYHRVTMVSTFSKVFQKILFEQINDHMQRKFSKHLKGFPKNHSTQNVLLVMIKKWKPILNKNSKLLFFLWIFQKRLIL